MPTRLLASLLATLLAPLIARSQDAPPFRISCPVIADTSVYAQFHERRTNLGKDAFLHLKGKDRFVLLQFDFSRLAGLEITSATLRLKRGQDGLARVGVSTIASTDWREGHGGLPIPRDQLGPQHDRNDHTGCVHPDESEGGATFDFAVASAVPAQARPWGADGSDLTDVTFGNGGSRWATVPAKYDVASRMYDIEIPPALVQAVALGFQPAGLCLADDFNRRDPNPTVFSRESFSPPELMVEARPATQGPPVAPSSVRVERDALGLEWGLFSAPHALGFEAFLSTSPAHSDRDLDSADQLPVWLMPTPGAAEHRVLLSYHRSSDHKFFAVRVAGVNGSWSLPVCSELPGNINRLPRLLPPTLPRISLPQDFSRPFTVDEGVPISLDGRYIRVQPRTWWDPYSGPVSLQSGRNEFVSFQVILAGAAGDYALHLDPWISPGVAQPAPRVSLFRAHHVAARLGRGKFAPEIAEPLTHPYKCSLDLLPPAGLPTSLPASDLPQNVDPPHAHALPDSQPATAPSDLDSRAKVAQPIWFDVYVPRDASPGLWRSRVVVVRDGLPVLDQPVELEVVPQSLPDPLAFSVSLTATQPPAAAIGESTDSPAAWELLTRLHQLAHEHRATLAILPFDSNGHVYPGFAPDVSWSDSGDPQFAWNDWDRRFARFFDGAAFRGLPRDGRPLDHFFLPFHESWPRPIRLRASDASDPLWEKHHFRPTWAELPRGSVNPRPDSYIIWPLERAVAPDFVRAQQAALRAWFAHFAENRWNSTRFQLYLNNPGSPRPDLVWWSLQQPTIPDDFRALAFFLGLYRDAFPPDSRFPLDIRADLAWPQFSRGLLERSATLTVIGAALFDKNDAIISHPQRYGRIWNDSGEIYPEYGWTSIYKWCWSARLAGATGLSIPDALGDDNSWKTADDDAILLPRPVAASLRLKALRRMQQDMEWLQLRIDDFASDEIPAGYVIATVGRELIERTAAKFPSRTTLLPLVKFGRDLDSVALEEIRRGLRGITAPNPPASAGP